MTQTVLSDNKNIPSAKKYSPALHNGIFCVNSNKATMLINFVLHMLALPFMLVMVIALFSNGQMISMYSELSVVTGIMCTGAGVISGIFTVCTVFRSMYNRQTMDMEFSMPMSSKTRFLSDYFSGLFVYTVPYLAAQIISLILWGIGTVMFDGKTLVCTSFNENFTWDCTFFSDNLSLCIEFIIGGFIIMLMFYTVWTFVVTCCGSMFEVIIYGAAANIVPPAVIGTVYLTLIESLYGMGSSSDRNIMKILGVTSPGGAIFGLFASAGNEKNIIGGNPDFFRGWWEWAILTLLVTAVIFAGAYLLYSRRTAEKTGQPFAYRFFYNVILTSVIFSICAVALRLMSDEEKLSPLAAMIIITFIIFMILEFFSHRGFRMFKRSLIKYFITVGASCGLFFIADATGFFGTEAYIPSPLAVSSVTLRYGGIYGSFPAYDVTISEKDNIGIIIDTHKKQLEEYKKEGWDSVTSTSISITYNLIGGRKVTRYYTLRPSAQNIILNLDMTDEYKREYLSSIDKLLDKYSVSGAAQYAYGQAPEELLSITFSDKFDNIKKIYRYYDIPADFIEKLKENLTADVNAMTADEYFSPSAPAYGYIHVPQYERSSEYDREYYIESTDILIRACYKNTKAYLDSLGFEFPEISVYDIYNMKMADGVLGINHFETNGDMFPITNVRGINRNSSLNIKEGDDEVIKEIIDNSFTEYIVGKDCYTINVGYKPAYIPEEYSAQAEKLCGENSVGIYSAG